MSEELYVATPDGQALRNEQPIHVSTTPTIQLDDWMAVPSDLHRKYTINYHGRVRTTGATIMSMCYVAAGMASAALIGSCKAWDIAPALALVHNAGAELWGLDGQIVDISTMLHPDAKTPTMICAPQDQFQQYRDTIEKI
jgi:myo-inositol-1(or 4)-monophosphatase